MQKSSRASSVLQRNVKQYGPMNALNMEDGSSCWYSEGGDDSSTQSYTVTFGRKVLPKEVRIQFQAGFSAEDCQVHIRSESGTWELVDELEASDTHELQTFPLDGSSSKVADAMKIVFGECTDFYGRVMVYRLGVYGTEIENK